MFLKSTTFCAFLASSAYCLASVPDQIAQLTEANRASIFEKILVSDGCGKVGYTFYQGKDSRGAGYWSVQCSSKAFQVMVENNSKGSAKSVDCETLKLIGSKCFTKFK
jgi:hypothetical protein